MNKFKNKAPKIFLIILLLVSLFLRLYRLSHTQTFLEDEGRDLLIVKRMLDTGKPALLGPQTSIGSMYLGPFYYYFITPALILSRMDPIGPAVFIAITGTLTVYLLFQLSKKWFGEKSAWIAALLYALMPLPVSFTRNSWNPDLAPLVSLLVIWTIDHLRTKKMSSGKWFLYLGTLTAILLQLHYMALIFIGIYLLTLFLWRWRDKAIFKYLLCGIIGFIILMGPYFVFEIRNNWVNTNAIYRFIISSDAPNIRYHLPLELWAKKEWKVIVSVFGGLFSRGGYRPFDANTPYISAIAVLFTALGIFFSHATKKRKIILGASVLGSIFLLGIYQEQIHVHYLGFLFSLIYLAFSGLSSSKNKYISLLGVISAIFILSYSLPITWGNISQGESLQVQKARNVADYIAVKAGSSPYNIVSSSVTASTPYQYFLQLQDNKPSLELQSKVFLICQDAPCKDSDVNNSQLFLTGPAHPSLTNYIGHPLINDIEISRIKLISNDHVSNGIWVAELELKNTN